MQSVGTLIGLYEYSLHNSPYTSSLLDVYAGQIGGREAYPDLASTQKSTVFFCLNAVILTKGMFSRYREAGRRKVTEEESEAYS